MTVYYRQLLVYRGRREGENNLWLLVHLGHYQFAVMTSTLRERDIPHYVGSVYVILRASIRKGHALLDWSKDKGFPETRGPCNTHAEFRNSSLESQSRSRTPGPRRYSCMTVLSLDTTWRQRDRLHGQYFHRKFKSNGNAHYHFIWPSDFVSWLTTCPLELINPKLPHDLLLILDISIFWYQVLDSSSCILCYQTLYQLWIPG